MAACGGFVKHLTCPWVYNLKRGLIYPTVGRALSSSAEPFHDGQTEGVQSGTEHPKDIQDGREWTKDMLSGKEQITPEKEHSTDFSTKPYLRNKNNTFRQLMEHRFSFPEFLPEANIEWRHRVREKLERADMLKRRLVLEIPEFYVGSVLAVTASDEFAPGKVNRFVGICILRAEHGTRTNFTLRNVVDRQGVEITYDLYNPCILKIEVLRLEKRLDEQLLYLRDADPEYSLFPFNMEAEHHPENVPVPINTTKVKLRPPPWFARWELWDLKGIEHDYELPEWRVKNKEKAEKPWIKWDIMGEYRKRISEEDQIPIWQEVEKHHEEIKVMRKADRRKQLQQKSFFKQ